MDKPEWVLALEAKHGKPIEQIPGTVYVLCYDPPQIVKSVSRDYSGRNAIPVKSRLLSERPITHYVGWTQQDNPDKRIANHGPATGRTVASLQSGTMLDEQAMKETGACPRCGEALWRSLATDSAVYEQKAQSGN
jgi:hypothetical protein